MIWSERVLRTVNVLGVSLSVACSGEPPALDEAEAGIEALQAEGVTLGSAAGDGSLVSKIALIDPSCNDGLDEMVAAEDRARQLLDSIAANADLIIGGAGRDNLERRFGPLSQADVEFIFETFARVSDRLEGTTYQCRPVGHEDCIGDFATAYARTSKSGPIVRLCPAYFSSVTSTATRAGVMIHELTHHNRNSPNGEGTDDTGFPSIHTALSYELFAPDCLANLCLD